MIFSVTAPGPMHSDFRCTLCGRPGCQIMTLDTDPQLSICECCLFKAAFDGVLPVGYKPRHYPTKEEMEAEEKREKEARGALSLADDTRGRLSLSPKDSRGRLSLTENVAFEPRQDPPWWDLVARFRA